MSGPRYLADLQRDRGWTGRIHLRVNVVFAGHWKVGHLQPSRVVDDHELVCFLGGETEVVIGERRYRCRGGEALIKPPGVVQFSRAIAPPVDRICVHFDWDRRRAPGRVEPISFLRDGPPDPTRIRPTPDWVALPIPLHRRFPDREFRARAMALPSILAADPGPVGLARLEAATTELLLRLIDAPEVDEPPRPEAESLALRAKAAIEQRYAEDLSLGALAAELGTAPAVLSRRFRAAFGVSPKAHLQEQRFQVAHELLRAGERSVAEVAAAVGFTDPNYFARAFAKRWGVAPSRVG